MDHPDRRKEYAWAVRALAIELHVAAAKDKDWMMGCTPI